MAAFSQQFGRRLKQVREASKLTQAELAELLNSENLKISSVAISAWETGRSIPNIEQFDILCRTLKCRPEHLLHSPVIEERSERPSWTEILPLELRGWQKEDLEEGIRLFRALEAGYDIQHILTSDEFGGYDEQSLYSLLSAAFRFGSIRITRVPHDEHYEQQLASEFPDLKSIDVALTRTGVISVIGAELVAFLAATEILPNLKYQPPAIGLGPGLTIARMAELSIPTTSQFVGTTWVPLVSFPRSNYSLVLQRPNYTARVMVQRHTGSNVVYLPFIGRNEVGQPKIDDLSDLDGDAFKEVQSAWTEMKMAFVTVGSRDKGSAHNRDFPLLRVAEKIETANLHKDIVGEFLCLYLDKSAEPSKEDSIKAANWAEAFQIDLDDLRRVVARGHVYLVAAGEYKAEAVAMAIRKKLVNCLIIDSEIAAWLLNNYVE